MNVVKITVLDQSRFVQFTEFEHVHVHVYEKMFGSLFPRSRANRKLFFGFSWVQEEMCTLEIECGSCLYMINGGLVDCIDLEGTLVVSDLDKECYDVLNAKLTI